jgi:seryl-tRNA synthetase
MLDIKFIRENPEKVKEAIRKKMIDFDLDKFLEIDQKRKELMKEAEELN